MTANTSQAWGAHAPRGRNRLIQLFVRSGLSRGPARRLAQLAWRNTPGEPVDLAYHGLKLRLWPEDNVTDRKIIFRSGLRDAVYLEPLRRHARPDATFADIGANIGYYSLHALAAGFGKTVAIEPSPALLPRLRFHLESNAPAERFHVAPVAVAEKSGTLFLHRKGEHGGATVETSRQAPDDVQVDVRTLADVLDQACAGHVSAFKIDIEGHEDRALLPWLAGLADSRLPRCGVIETCHSDRWNEDVMERLLARGYRVIFADKGNAIVARD